MSRKKDKYYIIYMWNLKNKKKNEYRNRVTEIREQTSGYQQGERKGEGAR